MQENERNKKDDNNNNNNNKLKRSLMEEYKWNDAERRREIVQQ